jgi:WD40 repeat protein
MENNSLTQNIKRVILNNLFQNKIAILKTEILNKSFLEACLRAVKKQPHFITLDINNNAHIWYKNIIYENTIKYEKEFPNVTRYLKLRDDLLIMIGDDMLITTYNNKFERIEILGYNANYCQAIVKLTDDLFLTAHMEGFIIWSSTSCKYESEDEDYYLAACKINEQEFALVNDEGDVKIFNYITFSHVEQFKVDNPQSIFCLKENDLFVMSWNDTLSLYNRSTKISEVGFTDQKDCLTILDSEHFAIAWDEEVHVYNAYTGDMVYALKGHEQLIFGISLLDDSLATFARDGVIKIWNLKTRSCIRTINFNASEIKSIFSINKYEVYIGGLDSLYSFDTRQLEYWDILKAKKGINAITWLDETQIAYSTERFIEIYDLQFKKVIRRLKGHFSPITKLISLGDKLLLSYAEEQKFCLWNTLKRKPLAELKLPQDDCPKKIVKLSHNKVAYITNKNVSNINILDINTMSTVEPFPGEKCVNFVAFNDNEFLISTEGKKLKFLGIDKLDREVDVDGVVKNMVKISDRNVVICFDNNLQVWDITTMSMLANLDKHDNSRDLKGLNKFGENEFITFYDKDPVFKVWSDTLAIKKTLILSPAVDLTFLD